MHEVIVSVNILKLHFIFRAFMKGNSDKEFFIEQRKAAGIQNATLQRIVEHIFPENRQVI